MTSNWNMGASVCDSQNFTLRLSEGSTIEENLSLSHFNMNKETEDVIVISDSSCSSSPERSDKSKWKSNLSSKDNKKKEYGEIILDSSSDSEDDKKKLNPLKKPVRYDNKFADLRSINKTVIQIDTKTIDNKTNEALLISDDTLLTSDKSSDVFFTCNDTSSSNDKTAISKDTNYGKNQLNKFNVRSPILMHEQEINLNSIGQSAKETNKIIKSATYNSSNILSRMNKHPICKTPQDSTGKARLTKKDARKIFRNVKGTQVAYNTPKEKKETNVIIDESIDADEDEIHPALSASYIKKVQHLNGSPDVIESSLKNHIIPDSEMDLSESSKTDDKYLDMPQEENLYRPLSEKKKKQIAEWLTNCRISDSRSSSSSIIPPSVTCSNSGNSSLERLELNYETPNNREKFNKTRTDEKQRTIIESDRIINSFLTRQTTLDQFFKKSKNNTEFRTPDNKPKSLKAQTEVRKTSSAINAQTKDVAHYVDILDKLYGTSWRDKADVLLPTEPQKTCVETINRIVQTERKPVSKNKYHIIDSDSGKSNFVKNNTKSNQERNIQRKQKKVDSFIDDESSGNDSESTYHRALTNPTSFFTNSTSKTVPVPASIKRLQMICDTDTESEDDKSNSDAKRNLNRRKLSFSDNESSSTSEYDPGDYIPPKGEVKKPQSFKDASSSNATTKFVEHQTFLASLSNEIPMNNAHPNAKKYRLNYKNNKEKLCKELYKLYNEKVFDNKLPKDMSIEWNIRMRGTAGYCYNKKTVKTISGVARSSRIVLATKILDTPDRLRDTLIHEMCHAASWLINNVSDGHGPFWTEWANKAMKIFPELPPIRRCHDYQIKTKFTYRCTGCGYSIGRHSKSLNIETKRCGYCYGQFELLINKTTKSGTIQMQTPKREPTGFALYVKQNYNSIKKEKNMRHADVMKLLGQQFSAIKITKKDDIVND
ncbi:hypothetical protein P5V15_008902 [Pogonomyrmex californicus]